MPEETEARVTYDIAFCTKRGAGEAVAVFPAHARSIEGLCRYTESDVVRAEAHQR